MDDVKKSRDDESGSNTCILQIAFDVTHEEQSVKTHILTKCPSSYTLDDNYKAQHLFSNGSR